MPRGRPNRGRGHWGKVVNLAARWKIILGCVAAFGGAVAAMPVVEPYFPAHRQFVRDGETTILTSLNNLSHQFEDARRETQIDAARKAISEARQSKAKWVLEYNRLDASSSTKGLAEQQITDIDNNIQALTDQLRSLQRLKK